MRKLLWLLGLVASAPVVGWLALRLIGAQSGVEVTVDRRITMESADQKIFVRTFSTEAYRKDGARAEERVVVSKNPQAPEGFTVLRAREQLGAAPGIARTIFPDLKMYSDLPAPASLVLAMQSSCHSQVTGLPNSRFLKNETLAGEPVETYTFQTEAGNRPFYLRGSQSFAPTLGCTKLAERIETVDAASGNVSGVKAVEPLTIRRGSVNEALFAPPPPNYDQVKPSEILKAHYAQLGFTCPECILNTGRRADATQAALWKSVKNR